MDLNKVMIIGRLTKNPEVRATNTGKQVATFSLATNSYYNDASGQRQEKAEFHNVVVWGKLAEICGQFLSKGRRAYVEGRLQTRDWVAQDGTRKYTTEIVAENMIILDTPSGTPRPSGSFGTAGQEVVEEERTIEEIPF